MKKKGIKNLIIQAPHRKLLIEFQNHLKVLGYADYVIRTLPASVKEFIYQMEQKDKTLLQITSQDLKDYYAYLLERPNYNTGGALSSSTISGHLYGIRLFFQYLHTISYLSINPMTVLRFPASKSAPRQVLSREEIDLLYAACADERELTLMGLFYGCGLRRSEGIMLKLRDVDFRGCWLYVRSGKGKKRRVLPLTEKVAFDLKTYCTKYRPNQFTKWSKPIDYKAFMLNKIGTKMKGGTYDKCFKEILQRSGIKKKVSLHNLRHSIATHLLMGGMSIEKVRDFLGHEFLETTQVYTHVITEELDLWT